MDKSLLWSEAQRLSRDKLNERSYYDFRDYGFIINRAIEEAFYITPSTIDDKEVFLFFFPKEDIENQSLSLFNLHCHLKITATLAEFAHGLGESVKNQTMETQRFLGKQGIGYERSILLSDLFKGGEHIIPFIGGTSEQEVIDSHYYLMHKHMHIYSGMIYIDKSKKSYYETLRNLLFNNITLL